MLIIIVVSIICLTLGLVFLLLQNNNLEVSKSTSIKKNQEKNKQKQDIYLKVRSILFKMQQEKQDEKQKQKITISIDEFLSNKEMLDQLFEILQRLEIYYNVFCIIQFCTEEQSSKLYNIQQYVIEQFKGRKSELLKINNEQSKIAIIRAIQPKVHFEQQKIVIEKLHQFIEKIFVVKDLIDSEEINLIKFNNTSNKIEIFSTFNQAIKRTDEYASEYIQKA